MSIVKIEGMEKDLKKKGLIATIAICMVFAFMLSARAEESLEFNLEQVVVTATKTPTKLKDVPAAVEVITAEDLKKRHVKRVSDVLKFLPGIYIREPMGMMGNDDLETISMRGLITGTTDGSKYIAFLIDGQPINNGYSGAFNFSTIPVENIERIEVIKGSFSALYGSNAMAGVVNIVTKEKPEDAITLRLTAGEMGTKKGAVSASGSAGKLDYFLDVIKTESDGYTTKLDYLKAKPGSEKARYPGKNGMDSESYNAKFVYHFDEMSKLNIAIAKNDHSYFWENDANKNDRKEDHLLISYENQLDERSSLKVSYGQHTEKKIALTTIYSKDKIASYNTEDIPSKIRQAEIQYNYQVTPKDLLTLGYVYKIEDTDIRQNVLNRESNGVDWGKTQENSINNAGGKTINYAFYLQNERKIDDKTTLYLGGRYDNWHFKDGYRYVYNKDEKQYKHDQVEDLQATNFSPKAALVYKANDKLTLRTSVGKAFRTPDLRDLLKRKNDNNKIYIPNAQLEPEESINYELGLDYQISSSLLGKLNIFLMDFDNLIVTKETLPTNPSNSTGKTLSEMINAGQTRIKGIELGLNKQWGRDWTTFINYTYTDAKFKENELDPKSVGKQLDYVPKNMFNVGVIYQKQKWAGSLCGNYVSDPKEDQGSGYGSYSSYFVLDFNMSYAFDEDTKISLSVDNMLDKEYYSWYLAQPRTAYLEFSKRF